MNADDYLQRTHEQLTDWLTAQGLQTWACIKAEHSHKTARLLPLLDNLPKRPTTPLDLAGDSLVFGGQGPPSLVEALQSLKPWRKGPFRIGGVDITSEWNCAIKWRRFENAIAALLPASRVLDLGGGNGYFAWRCLLAGASATLVVDPNPLAWAQWLACQHYAGDQRAGFLPCSLEKLPVEPGSGFDLILCLGVIYHSPAPFALLRKLRELLAPGAILVIESLVIDGDAERVLTPTHRYAAMPNVWAIPSTLALERWLKRCGFKRVELIAPAAYTKAEEQSASVWSQPFSLADALKPDAPTTTIEGYPAPQRAIFMADPDIS